MSPSDSCREAPGVPGPGSDCVSQAEKSSYSKQLLEAAESNQPLTGSQMRQVVLTVSQGKTGDLPGASAWPASLGPGDEGPQALPTRGPPHHSPDV